MWQWKQDIAEILRKELGIEIPSEVFSICPDRKWGDVSVSCFALAGKIKKSPAELAKILSEKLQILQWVETAIPAGPYVNIKIRAEQLFCSIGETYDSALYGAVFPPRHPDGSVIVEYCSPNTNKPLHLGHLRNIMLGDSVIRLLQTMGHQVIRANITNDRGIHIMKSLLAYMKWGNGETPESKGIKGDHFVGTYYVMFSQKSAEDQSLETEAQALLQKWEAGDEEVRKLTKQMNDWVLAGMHDTYESLGIGFDEITLESEIYEQGKAVVQKGVESGVFYQKEDGAVGIDLSDIGLDEKILLRRDGTSVYMTQDLALAQKRYEEHPDVQGMVYVVAREQEYHFKVLFEILKRLGMPWVQQCYHLSYGMVNLPTGRMKSREGTVVDADDLIQEMIALAHAEVSKRWPELSDQEAQNRARMIGLGALRFYLLRVSPSHDMVFNPEESISFDGMTGPYVQYAYARMCSILAGATEYPTLTSPDIKEGKVAIAGAGIDWSVLGNEEERSIALLIMQYSEKIQQAVKTYNPSVVAQYCYDVAQAVNTFYHAHRVLQAETLELAQARLALIAKAKQVLQSALSVLGIDAPEKM